MSVFTKWRTDTEDVREKSTFGHDFTLWKLEKFVKDVDQRNIIERCIFDNFFKLKSMFLEIVSETSFPQMSQLGWHSMCVRMGIIDKKHLKLVDVDRIFISARFEEEAKAK